MRLPLPPGVVSTKTFFALCAIKRGLTRVPLEKLVADINGTRNMTMTAEGGQWRTPPMLGKTSDEQQIFVAVVPVLASAINVQGGILRASIWHAGTGHSLDA